MNSTEGFFTGEINGRRVLLPVTDEIPLDPEGMKMLAGEETQVQENLRKGLTSDGRARRPSSSNITVVDHSREIKFP